MPLILLVDDDEMFREMLRLTLVKMGYDVLAANNGKEAERLFKQTPPDVLMTDIIMPEMEGLETILRLRHMHPGVKIIAMSGGGRVGATDYLRTAKTMGAGRVLAKPFSDEEMAAALDELLETRQSTSLRSPQSRPSIL